MSALWRSKFKMSLKISAILNLILFNAQKQDKFKDNAIADAAEVHQTN